MNSLVKITSILCIFGCSGAFAAPSVTAIVGNWHFDEGKGQKTLDVSGNIKTAQLGSTATTDINDPLWVARRFDNPALKFDGNSSFVHVPYSIAHQPQKVTVEAWVKGAAENDSGLRYIVTKSNYSCSTAAYALYSHDGEVSFYISPAKGVYTDSPVALNVWDGQWHHLVGTYDRKTVRLYVDGVQVGTGTSETQAIAYNDYVHKDLYIGAYDNGSICFASDPEIVGTYTNASFSGDIDEVRIWSRALSAVEVANLN